MTQVLTRSSSTNKNIIILLYYVKHKAFAYIYIYIYIYMYHYYIKIVEEISSRFWKVFMIMSYGALNLTITSVWNIINVACYK